MNRPFLFAICVRFYGPSGTPVPTKVVLNRSREILRFLIEQKTRGFFILCRGRPPGRPAIVCDNRSFFRDAEDVIPYGGVYYIP